MLKIKEVADHLGLSKSQARRRVKAVKSLVSEDSISRGDYNEILVKQDAFEILKQLEEYRKAGNTTKEAKEKIKEDLGNEINSEASEDHQSDPIKRREPNQLDTHQPDGDYVGLVKEQYEKRLAEKDERIRELQRDKQRLQEKNDTLEQRLLTGEAEDEEDNFKELGLIQVIKKWFATKT
ncbi:hypothetical protein KGY71_02405 [Candidatus Bipolaricaulota bacterium]|nr:hypothetical protein [Candidatus Bipolaricaulota bacterium]